VEAGYCVSYHYGVHQNGLPVKVVTANRLTDEKIGVWVLLTEFLTQNKIDHLVCETLDCSRAVESDIMRSSTGLLAWSCFV